MKAPEVRALLEGRKTMTRRVLSRQNVTVLGSSWARKSSPWEGLLFDHPAVERRTQSTLMQAIVGDAAPYDLHLDVPFVHPQDAARGTTWEEDGCVYRVRPVIEVGDRLWVRESGYERPERSPQMMRDGADTWERFYYRADMDAGEREMLKGWGFKSRPSIHMPRWASRLTLIVSAVKVERLQEISEGDVEAEGLARLSKDGGRVYKWGVPDSDGLPGGDDHGWHWIDWCRNPRDAFRFLWNEINGPDAWSANPWVVALTFTVHRCNIDRMKDPA